ncbi:SDR family oxidoreductase [Streptomyces kunmingensis]|uniref:SDR family oxidoreductase n=1 Tax=Streptomyces kunmingensis TaxID=68225 RepID=A0ABU6CK65_9ACTN|nr:SDR family oxidoreductase [Streptomyces kunmingensis]MEB3965109.1 SDR family oxidoreductase [Streptomyces kunmingensis]
MGQLNDKVAVITGGTSGIGLATARRFVDEGAFVYITGRRATELQNALTSLGERAAGIQGDVSDPAAVDRVIDAVAERQGHIDVVVANAGGGSVIPLEHITFADYERHFSVNVAGALFTVQKSLPLMSSGGSIILVGSVNGSRNVPQMSLYGATKAALRSLGRSWAYELSERGIRVNTLSPGPIETPAFFANTEADDEDAMRRVREQVGGTLAMGRMGRPEEVAAAALFLASGESSFTTGAELFTDGGQGQM